MDHIKPVKTAVIGCGMISNIYIRNLKNLFHIIDLLQRDNAKARELKPGGGYHPREANGQEPVNCQEVFQQETVSPPVLPPLHSSSSRANRNRLPAWLRRLLPRKRERRGPRSE